MAVASLVLGIIGVLFSLNPILGLVPSLIAMILGIVARKQLVAQQRPSGMAIAGMILGIVGTAMAATIFALCAMCAKNIADAGQKVGDEMQKAAERQANQPAAALGETVTFDDSEWVVLAASELKVPASKGVPTTKRYIVVDFRLTNTGEDEDMLFETPLLHDAQGREHRRWTQASTHLPEGKTALFMAPLQRNNPRTLTEIYEVPADATGLVVNVRALVLGGKRRAVALGL